MATIGNTYTTYADVRKQSDSKDEIVDIIEILAQQLDMIGDAPIVECNDGNGHLTTMRAGLPTPTWTMLYQGVQPTKGITTQVRDTTGTMEDWSEVDVRLLEKTKNPGKLRMNGAKAHIMGIAQELGRMVIYGNTATDPRRFTGLAPRYNSLSADNGNQIIDAGGVGSTNTSVWFICWGEETVHLLYPEGSTAGLRRKDIGEETKELADGSLYRVAREHFCMNAGLSLRDWRGVARIANIDVPSLTADATVGVDIIDQMVDAYYALDNPGRADQNCVIYTSKTVAKFLHKQAMNKKNVQLSLEEHAGRKVTTFLGHPIRRMDTILETEARVV